MSEKVRDILRTGDICEIKNIYGNEIKLELGETFAICIEGRLYEALDNDTVLEVKDYEEKIVRILRPIKVENALDFWRYAFKNNWRALTSNDLKLFKTIYIQDKPLGIILNVLRNDLSYRDDKVIDCVRRTLEFNPMFNLRLLWELLNTTIRLLLAIDEYGLAYTGRCICITRMSDHQYIAEITENNHQKE